MCKSTKCFFRVLSEDSNAREQNPYELYMQTDVRYYGSLADSTSITVETDLALLPWSLDVRFKTTNAPYTLMCYKALLPVFLGEHILPYRHKLHDALYNSHNT